MLELLQRFGAFVGKGAARQFLWIAFSGWWTFGGGTVQGQIIPIGVMAAPGDAEVTLSWDRVGGVSSYKVKRFGGVPVEFVVPASDSQRVSLMAANLVNGINYGFTIRSVVEGFESPESAVVRFAPSAGLLDLLPAGARIEKLAGGFQFTEGPVWTDADGGYLVFSDIDGNQLWRWKPGSGASSYRRPSNRTNGNTRDHQGRLISCQQVTRSVTRTEHDGTITTLVTEYKGKRFNEPNDVVVKSDGSVWFTDPLYYNRTLNQPGRYVYRFDPEIGNESVTLVITDMSEPNGLCFSPDELQLYVSDPARGEIRVYDVLPDNTVTNGRRVVPHWADGIRMDSKRRLFTTGAGFRIYDEQGKLLGMLGLNSAGIPEVSANVCLGGMNNEMVFVCAGTSLYGITPMPDLVVTSVIPHPVQLTEGEPVRLAVVVRNQGTGATQEG
jgi:gluconolactonase